MAIQTSTLQERVREKKGSLKSLKASVGRRHFNGPMASPKDFSKTWDKSWDKGWNKDGH